MTKLISVRWIEKVGLGDHRDIFTAGKQVFSLGYVAAWDREGERFETGDWVTMLLSEKNDDMVAQTRQLLNEQIEATECSFNGRPTKKTEVKRPKTTYTGKYAGG